MYFSLFNKKKYDITVLTNEMQLKELQPKFKCISLFDNTSVCKFLKENKIILLGGSILSLLKKTTVNDYDLYIKGDISVDDLKNKIKIYNQNNKYKLTFMYESKNSLSYNVNGLILQFITLEHLMHKNAKQIFDFIDFSICKCAYDFELEKFIFESEFIKSYNNNSIVFNPNTLYPISSLLRVEKYERKGYEFPTREMLKICFAINNLQIKTYKDVIIHLTAISTSYYADFLELLSTDNYKDLKFDGTEFFEIFDQYKNSREILNKLTV